MHKSVESYVDDWSCALCGSGGNGGLETAVEALRHDTGEVGIHYPVVATKDEGANGIDLLERIEVGERRHPIKLGAKGGYEFILGSLCFHVDITSFS